MNVDSEFGTVDAVIASGAETLGVDAFALALIKAERQIRRLVTHLVFQSPAFSASDVRTLRDMLAGRRDVYFEGFITGWDALYPRPISEIVGADYDVLRRRLDEAIEYRNKIFHGQLTRDRLTREQLLSFVKDIRLWCQALADGAEREVGFDGFARNSFRKSADHDLPRRLRVVIGNKSEYRAFIERHMVRRHGAHPSAVPQPRVTSDAVESANNRGTEARRSQHPTDLRPVLSVDLAYRYYRDLGAVALSVEADAIRCAPLLLSLAGEPHADRLAAFLSEHCEAQGIRMLLIDGPQGWKSEINPDTYRGCERELNTPAKTGLPGSVKPENYRPYVQFSIDLFDALAAMGWERLASRKAPLSSNGKLLIESFPLSAWASLGLKALPAKAKTHPSDMESALKALCGLVRLELSEVPNHDELQAIISGLAGLGLQRDESDGCRLAGLPPILENGIWREGYIVNPTPALCQALSANM